MSCLPVYNSYYREQTGKRMELSISTVLCNWRVGLPHNRKLLQESGELCSLYNSTPAKLAAVWCLGVVLGPYLYCCWSLVMFWALCVAFWRQFLVGGVYCSVLLSCCLFWGFLRLRKLAVCKLNLSRGGSYSVSWCVRPRIKLTPEYPFNI